MADSGVRLLDVEVFFKISLGPVNNGALKLEDLFFATVPQFILFFDK